MSKNSDSVDYKYSDDRTIEEMEERLARLDKENPSAELIDDGGVKITNDEEIIAEAQQRGEYSDPDVGKPGDADGDSAN